MKKLSITAMLLAWGIFLFAQGIYNDGAHIVSNSGSYWVVDNGDFTLTSSSATDPTQFDNLKIEADASLTLDAPSYLTVSGDLTVASGGSITLESTAEGTSSLIVEGTTSGNVTAQRYLTKGKWHYMSAPINDTRKFTEFLGLTAATGDDIDQFYWWDENGNDNGFTGIWFDILNASTGVTYAGGSFISAQGYAINYKSSGDNKTINFSGSPLNTDQSIEATYNGSSTGPGTNLVGNPYSSNIAITEDGQADDNFLTDNASILDENYQAIYLWNETGAYTSGENYYQVICNSGFIGEGSGSKINQDYVSPGQAFMIKVNADGNINFNADTRKHGTASFYKTKESWPGIELFAKSKISGNSTIITFYQGMTLGLDPSYDAAKMRGNPEIALYSKLIEDNGVDFAIQALPTESMENSIISIGMDVAEAAEIHFSIYQNGMDETNIRLEDRQNGIFTDLKSNEYSTLVSESGTGRFFLHIGNTTSVDEINGNAVQAYVTGGNIIIQSESPAERITLTDIAGRTLGVWEKVESIPAAKTAGVYLVSIEAEGQRITKKIIIE